MADFNSYKVLPTHIHTYTRFAPFELPVIVNPSNPGSVTWVANLAIYVPMILPFEYPVRRVFWINGTSTTGNADFGIYTFNGTKIYSTGSTARSGASAVQYVTPTTDFILVPGAYYFAISFAGTTNVGFATTAVTALAGRAAGVLQQASALPLPATATFAQLANALYPICGVTRTDTGF